MQAAIGVSTLQSMQTGGRQLLWRKEMVEIIDGAPADERNGTLKAQVDLPQDSGYAVARCNTVRGIGKPEYRPIHIKKQGPFRRGTERLGTLESRRLHTTVG